MAQPIVLITFYCRTGDTERLALEAAVGAVQARGFIRLRRLQDVDPSPGTDDLARMRKEYVPPTEKDVLGADALILVTSSLSSHTSPEWKSYIDLLNQLRDSGKLQEKVGTGIGVPNSFLISLGLTCADDESLGPLDRGRAAVEAVNRLRNNPS